MAGRPAPAISLVNESVTTTVKLLGRSAGRTEATNSGESANSCRNSSYAPAWSRKA